MNIVLIMNPDPLPSLLLLTTTISLSSIPSLTLSEVNEYCSVLKSDSVAETIVSILYREGEREGVQQGLKDCKEVQVSSIHSFSGANSSFNQALLTLSRPLSIFRELKFLIEPSPLPADRIERLAYLRDFHRKEVLSTLSKLSEGNIGSTVHLVTPLAVVLLDFDVISLPPPAAFLEGIWAVSSRDDESVLDATQDFTGNPTTYDVVCSHGYEAKPSPWGDKCLYDTYCLQFLDGTWPWEMLNTFTYLNFYLHRMYRTVSDNLDDAGVHEVKFCFGGLAIYNPVLFSQDAVEECGYRIADQRTEVIEELRFDPDGNACEHTVLQACLRRWKGLLEPIDQTENDHPVERYKKNLHHHSSVRAAGGFRIGIKANLVLRRDGRETDFTGDKIFLLLLAVGALRIANRRIAMGIVFVMAACCVMQTYTLGLYLYWLFVGWLVRVDYSKRRKRVDRDRKRGK